MGDYGLGLNSNVRALSPVDFNQLTNNQSLFAPDILSNHHSSSSISSSGSTNIINTSTTSTMQDETLASAMPMKKQGSPQPQQQGQPAAQQSPNGDAHPEQNSEDLLIRKSVSQNDEYVPDDRKIDAVTSPLQLGLSAEPNNTMLNSIAAPSFWSTATADDTFIQGFPAAMNGVTFQNFPPTHNALFNANMAGPQIGAVNAPQQQAPQRRAITGQHTAGFPPNMPQRQQQSNLFYNSSKTYPTWSSAPQQSATWTGPQSQQMSPWGSMQQQRRSVPNMNPIGAQLQQQKKNMGPSSVVISPSKFRRSTSFPGQMQQTAIGTKPFDLTAADDQHNRENPMLNFPQQERGGGTTYGDTMRFPALESHLLDIMRTTTTEHPDQYKSKHHTQPVNNRGYGKRQGKSPFGFGDDNHLLNDDGSLDQTVPNMNSPSRNSPNSQGIERIERYSRKVFVGGLPPDIDEEEITAAFRRFGPLVVDWPHKAESKSYFPPKGYCFLLFQDEMSVQALIEACIVDDEKLYWCVSSPTMKDKPVQIRPWNLSDSDFVMDGSQPLDPRKTIFVGGVPRPLRAVELAMIMDRLYGGVCYAGIDTDPELKYPKGAGRVAFSNQQSYIAAISARFVQLQHGDIDKRVEVKPYVLDDQMCDECQGARCGGKFAPFFCANVTCLQYYCEHCWAQIHSRPGREYHKPLVKEGADRPRAVPFRWC
ncbi:cytoplasmic polyadenylation element-binding protein 3-like isoform X2 [Tubulanus polymorphus]|uniref:cytoplasmic polyadenylation element-binding protein 3-like isoform X2 n=1 Tax=Tubulanus polymorphus TaxID=672921 RepID=UPI003DA55EE6